MVINGSHQPQIQIYRIILLYYHSITLARIVDENQVKSLT